jgi:AsmA protein
MRGLKILGAVIGGLVVLVALGLVAVWLLVNPNDYKDRIAQAVKASTGRELTLAGDLHLSVFPWVALDLGRATLGNPPGFDAEPFAAVEHAALRVKVLPLLHKQLQIGQITIDGLDLRLRKNAAGQGNWENFGKAASEAPHEDSPPPSVDLAGVALTHSRVAYDTLVLEDLNVTLGHVAPGVAIPVTISTSVRTDAKSSPLPLKAQLQLTMDPQAKRYRVTTLDLSGSLTLPGAPAPMTWSFNSPELALDLAAQTLADTRFEAAMGDARLSGTVAGATLLDEPALHGDVELKPLSPRQLMATLGMTPPATRDKAVLGKLGLHGAYAYAKKAVRAEKLAVQLDDTRLAGDVRLDLATGAKDFDLTLDRIDLDRYLPPPAAPTAAKAPFELPTDTLKSQHVTGSLAIGQATVSGLALTNLKVGLDADEGLIHLAPTRAQLYGGQFTGDITLDTRAATPSLKLKQTLSGIDVSKLLQDYAKTKRLSGKGTLAMDVSAQGRHGDALMKTLHGTVSANLTDGAVEGIDLWYGIAQAQSLVQKRTLADTPNTKRTAFETFKASADVRDGIATTKDLAVTSQQLRVSGQGTTNLVTQALDYRLSVTVLKAPPTADAAASNLALATIPVTVTGSFDDPKVRPDLGGIVKARLQQELDKHKDELKEKLQDKLKGLFQR